MSERDWNDAGPKAARHAGDNARRWTPPEEEEPKPNGKDGLHIKLIPFEQITIDDAGEEWLIKGITPRVGVGLMWGTSQTYKSFQEIDQDLHIALGWDYRGRRVQQGPVVYCAFEGGRGVSKRVEAWRRRHLSDHSEPVPFYLQPMRLELVKHVDELIAAIRDQLGGVNPVKISLDTLNRSMSGSESKDADMGAYLAAADKLREAFGCFVNIIHHPGWDSSRSRGHTSLPFGVEAEIAGRGLDGWLLRPRPPFLLPGDRHVGPLAVRARRFGSISKRAPAGTPPLPSSLPEVAALFPIRALHAARKCPALLLPWRGVGHALFNN